MTNRLREVVKLSREDIRAIENTRQLEPIACEMER